MSPNVQRRFTMTGALGAAYRDSAMQQHQQPSSLGSISNARSMANLQQPLQQEYDISQHYHPQQQQEMRGGGGGIIASSTSIGDLNTSEEDASGMGTASRKPILKKDSKYGSRRELPALGVSGVVSKGSSRPSIFEFWENMLTSTSTVNGGVGGGGGAGMNQLQQTDSMTAADVDGTIGSNGNDVTAAAAASGEHSRSSAAAATSMRRILPALPNQQSSLTVYTSTTGGGGGGVGSELVMQSLDLGSAPPLGSRGEVEGSSNQPSPTCLAGENVLHLDNANNSIASYWNHNNNNNETPSIVKTVNHQHEMLVDELNRAKKQLAQLQKMVSTSSFTTTTIILLFS